MKRLRQQSVELQQLNLDELQMPELQGYKQLRLKQLDKAEHNLLRLMAENARLQKKISAQQTLVKNTKRQSMALTN